MIPIKECKDNHLYIIKARNASIGIFNEKDSSFTISRTKFSSNYLFDEYHWDTGEPYGTAKCLKELEPVPPMEESEKLAYLNAKASHYREAIIECFKTDPFYQGFDFSKNGQWISNLNK